MKLLLTATFTLILYGNILAQIDFEKGYYIDNKGNRHECLIKNKDWKNNPSEFSCKDSTTSEIFVLGIDNVQEFGINNHLKYVRREIDYDTTKINSLNLDYRKTPKYKRIKAFLKVLTEGTASLYAYRNASSVQFYFSLNDGKITPLVYKKYYKKDEFSDAPDKSKIILKNEKFKQQLWSEFKCPNLTMHDAETLEYKAKSLIQYFERYNRCQNSDFHTYKEKRETFKFFLNVGMENANMTNFRSDREDMDFDFNNIYGYKFGFGLEYYLPFAKNKWALTLMPEYNVMQAETNIIYEHWVLGVGTENTDVTIESNYNNFKIPLGLRHYFYLNNKSKLFLNFNYYYLFRKDGLVTYSHEDFPDLNFEKFTTGFYAGAGITLFNKASAYINFEHRIPIYDVQKDYHWTSTFNALSFNLSYTLF